jgi:formylglycine-generating enzyme required for sulfatase activity
VNAASQRGLCAVLLVLGTSLFAADAPRKIEFAFKPVDMDAAYQRRTTWQDTLRASIEKLRNDHPAFALGRCKLDDKWFRAGPYAWPVGKEPSDVDFGVPLARVDLRAKKPDGTRTWELKGPVKAGQPYDLKLPVRSSVFQCRQFNADFAGSMDMVLSSEVPLTLWHNGEKLYELAPGETDLWNPTRLTLNIRKGRNELITRFDNAGRSETTRFYVRFNNLASTWHRTVEHLQETVVRDFTSPREAFEQGVDFDAKIWLAPLPPGDASEGRRQLAGRYAKVFQNRQCRDILSVAAREVQDADDLWAVRSACYCMRLLSTLEDRVNFEALRRAIADRERAQSGTGRGNAAGFLERVGRIEQQWGTLLEGSLGVRAVSDFSPETVKSAKRMTDKTFETFASLVDQWTALQRDVLLSNPAIDFDRILLIKRRKGNLGLPANWLGSGSMQGSLGDEMVLLSLRDPAAEPVTAFKPEGRQTIADVDLNWDGRRVLYSAVSQETGTWQIFESVLEPDTGKAATPPRQLTPKMGEGVKNYDACYLPDDRVVFCSTAVRQGVPCLAGRGEIANLFLLSKDRQAVRQLCFDQDHNWNPTVLNNGRVLYARWEYMDTPHYFPRLLFHMNPDGTGQMSYYGSNSYWPNAIFYARPIPGHPTKVVGIVSGHHGVARMGELVIFDPALGRQEADGVVQRIPGYGQEVEPVIADHLVNNSWPKFLHPYPIDEKNFLVASQSTPGAKWGLYWVDVFDNMLLLKESEDHVFFEPLPFRSQAKPPVVADRVDLSRRDAVVYVQDVYTGPGLKGVPRGSITRMRLLEPHYNYSGARMGGYKNAALEGGWEPKRIIGTVPVEEDGSAVFRVPANTPLILQPVDGQGRAYQIMRSWMTAMPGESVSCIGCHESQDRTVQSHMPLASNRAPADIEPWYGLQRGFDFVREVQPVLNSRCVKCHDGSTKLTARGKKVDRPNFADTAHGDHEFYKSYLALHPYIRRPGPEGDYHMLKPLEYHASTSELVQMLEKGHHGVKLTAEEWDRLVTWIDMNAPCFGTWSDRLGREFYAEQHAKRLEMRRLYASVTDDPEEPLGDPTSPLNKEFLARKSLARTNVPDLPALPRAAVTGDVRPPAAIDGWPFEAAVCEDRVTVSLTGTVKLELVRIPAGSFFMGTDAGYVDEGPRRVGAIDAPFYMATVETSNEMFALFDPTHDTRFIDMPGMSQTREGRPANQPRQPVARITWTQATAFCRWLSEKTGDIYTLPTEAQWEWACRSGTDTPFSYGDVDADFSRHANFADKSIIGLSYTRYGKAFEDFIPRDGNRNDKHCVSAPVGSYEANAFGLHDMHGNVSEWTLSDYGPCGAGHKRKVVRGGSWRDRPKKAHAAWRWGYYAFQPVFDVGFRVVRAVNAERVSSAKRHSYRRPAASHDPSYRRLSVGDS